VGKITDDVLNKLAAQWLSPKERKILRLSGKNAIKPPRMLKARFTGRHVHQAQIEEWHTRRAADTVETVSGTYCCPGSSVPQPTIGKSVTKTTPSSVLCYFGNNWRWSRKAKRDAVDFFYFYKMFYYGFWAQLTMTEHFTKLSVRSSETGTPINRERARGRFRGLNQHWKSAPRKSAQRRMVIQSCAAPSKLAARALSERNQTSRCAPTAGGRGIMDGRWPHPMGGITTAYCGASFS